MLCYLKSGDTAWRLWCVVSLFWWSVNSYASNLGVMGKMFPIAEPDLIHMMQSRLAYLKKIGYMKKMQGALRRQAKHYADRPAAVRGLTTTRMVREWYYDPSITMPQDIDAPNGVRLISAGTRYNPLKKVTLDETLIFYNADDPSQVTFVEKENQALKGKDKLILVNGSILSQEKHFKQPIYFDQWGQLTTRFHIQHVPAIIFQAGYRLKVREIVP